MNPNLFEDIDKVKKDLPKIKTITAEVSTKKLNFYQRVASVTLVVCFFLGIIFGNVFPACTATSGFYGNTCIKTEFNFSLTIFVWAVSFLGSVFIYWMGHVISLLTAINEKLVKSK